MSEVYDLRRGQVNLSDWFKHCLKLYLLLKCVCVCTQSQRTLMEVSSLRPHCGSCADSGLAVAISLLNQHTACVWLILETKSHCITQTGLELMTSCLSLLNAGFQDSNNPHWERLLPFALPLCLLDRSLSAQSCGLLLTKLVWERAGWRRNAATHQKRNASHTCILSGHALVCLSRWDSTENMCCRGQAWIQAPRHSAAASGRALPRGQAAGEIRRLHTDPAIPITGVCPTKALTAVEMAVYVNQKLDKEIILVDIFLKRKKKRGFYM